MENTGNFRDFGPPGADLQPKKPCPLGDFWRNSLLNGTGNYFGGTGNFLGVTGNSIRRAGKARGDSLNPEHGLAAFRERSPRRVSAPVPILLRCRSALLESTRRFKHQRYFAQIDPRLFERANDDAPIFQNRPRPAAPAVSISSAGKREARRTFSLSLSRKLRET
jgi:hypothetical protein